MTLGRGPPLTLKVAFFVSATAIILVTALGGDGQPIAELFVTFVENSAPNWILAAIAGGVTAKLTGRLELGGAVGAIVFAVTYGALRLAAL